MNACLFCKIVRGEIAAKKVYEDEYTLAFQDIHPQAPVHLLLIPKKHIESLLSATAEDEKILGKLLALAPRLAREQGLEEGFKTAINTGAAGGQEIYHLHLHVYGAPT
jgi:histidine triad (HIT) family protein